MSKKICNEMTTVSTGIEYNDKDCIAAINSSLKELGRNYMIAISEASSDTLFNTYKNIIERIIELQREAFLLMFDKGWYCLEEVDCNKITNKYNTLKKDYDDLDI